ncbi:MAG: GyrI-like domain-containing protein [Pseudomonadota bacterium]
MPYKVVMKTLTAQPVIFKRADVNISEIGEALAQILPSVFQYVQDNGLTFAGPPFARYVAFGPGKATIEAGMPIAEKAAPNGEFQTGSLPAGPAATTIHTGDYQKLSDAHAAVETWISEQTLAVGGAPWEWYVDDPTDFPNGDWKTEIIWPLTN